MSKIAKLTKIKYTRQSSLKQRQLVNGDRPCFEVIVRDGEDWTERRGKGNKGGLTRQRTILRKGIHCWINKIGDAWHGEKVKVLSVLKRSDSIQVRSSYDQGIRFFTEGYLSPVHVVLSPTDWQLYRLWKSGADFAEMRKATKWGDGALWLWHRKHRLAPKRQVAWTPYDSRTASPNALDLRNGWLVYPDEEDEDDAV